MTNLMTAMKLAGACGMGSLMAQITIDDKTHIPLGIAASICGSVFLIGMWLSRKLTRIEDRLETIETRLNAGKEKRDENNNRNRGNN